MGRKGILFLPQDMLCEIEGAESVLEVALRNDLDIGHSCGGMGSCTTCRIVVEKSVDSLPPRNELEEDIATMRGFSDQERLSCQLPPLNGLVVRIPETFEPDSTM
jgi:2Fe-2S ferredoxin